MRNILIIVISGMLLWSAAGAEDLADVGITCWHQNDTIYAGKHTTCDMYFENDTHLYGAIWGHRFFSNDGVTWEWLAVAPHYYDVEFFSFNEESRMPDESCWDMGMGVPSAYDDDGISPDTVIFGGVAMMVGLEPGPYERLYSYHMKAIMPEPEGVYNFCIDSCFVPPSGAFVFVNMMGSAFCPTIAWPYGGRCWPVVAFPYVCGDVNGDDDANVGDAIYMLNTIFQGGPSPTNMYLADTNGDGAFDVGDVVYLLGYIFKFGPEPVCP